MTCRLKHEVLSYFKNDYKLKMDFTGVHYCGQ